MRLRNYISSLLLAIYMFAISGVLLDVIVPCKCGHSIECLTEHSHDEDCDCCYEMDASSEHLCDVREAHCEHKQYVDTSLYVTTQQNETISIIRWTELECQVYALLDIYVNKLSEVKLSAFHYCYTPILLEQIYKATGFRAPPVLV